MQRAESHPGKPLQEHLAEVARGARDALDHPALRSRDILAKVGYIVGVSHDVGKYTSFFQDYLHTERTHGGLEYHAFPSAMLAAWLTHRLVGEPPWDDPIAYLPLQAFVVVHRHHGNLKAPERLVPDLSAIDAWTYGEDELLPQTLQRFRSQWNDLHARREMVVPELTGLGLEGVDLFFENLTEATDTLEHLARMLHFLGEPTYLSEANRARLALWGQLLFSALIDADKRSAAGLPSLPPRPYLAGDLVERYVAHRFPHPRHNLDRERAAFFASVTAQARKVTLPLEVPLSLTAPTGMGKTLAALSAAFVLRERLAEQYGQAPHVVYALPFINLIEQNYQVVRDVLTWGAPDFAANEHRYLLRHHHLADIGYRVGNENLPVAEALLLTEGWESEIVVTTFVQVFQTLFGYQNRLLRKMHNLIGGILILDELQSLKMEYWDGVGRVFDVLREEMGLTVLQMTATRPLIFSRVKELYPDPPHLFGLMRRTSMDVDLEGRSVEQLADEVANLAETHGSVLVVVNTVRTSLELYNALSSRKLGQSVAAWCEGPSLSLPLGQRALVYLSTNVVSKHRAERLAFLRAWLNAGGQAVVVATQVVEAGVDLDFPAAVRTLGPLDSIVQVAGRCNREGRRPTGWLFVRRLTNSGAAHVYGAVHLQVAKQLLSNVTHLDEPEYARLVERYFAETKKRKSQDDSHRLWQAYTFLRYDDKDCSEKPCLSEFRLIEEMPQISVFVALCAEDERWLREVFTPQVLKEKDWKRRQEAFLRHRRFLYEHVLQVPEFRAKKNAPPEWSTGLRWVPVGQLGDFYDLETGFRWADEDLDRAWIV